MRPRWERRVVNPHTQTRWHTLLEKLDTGTVAEKRLKEHSLLSRGVVLKKVYLCSRTRNKIYYTVPFPQTSQCFHIGATK